jgi:hypothetical protein
VIVKEMKKLYLLVALLLVTLVACCEFQLPGIFETKEPIDGSFDFVIYESDSDNSNLSDNVVVARYSIEYVNCATVTDALIKKDNAYYFSEDSKDYLILVDSGYGLSYTGGYFQDYLECADGKAIDVSWTYIAVNGEMAQQGIGETKLEDLVEFGFVINGWK